jgi:hypothetical protein
MLDVHEYDSLVNDSARAAAVALMSDTTALAIRAVLEGREGLLGRRTMTAVQQLLAALTILREQPHAEHGAYVFKNEDITSGVGRLIGKEDSDRPGTPELLELSKAIAIDADGRLVINNTNNARALADTLEDLGAALTDQSALSYARSRSSYSE